MVYYQATVQVMFDDVLNKLLLIWLDDRLVDDQRRGTSDVRVWSTELSHALLAQVWKLEAVVAFVLQNKKHHSLLS